VSAATPTPAPLPAGTREEDRDINITLSEWSLQPSRPKLPAGKVRIVAENTGATPHAIQIVGRDFDVGTDNFGPGTARTLIMTLPPGEYQLICPIPGHPQQGMVNTLTVVGP